MNALLNDNNRFMSILLAVVLILAVMTSGLLALWVKPFLVVVAAYLMLRASQGQAMVVCVQDWLVLAWVSWMALSLLWSAQAFYTTSSLVIIMLFPVVYFAVRMGAIGTQALLVAAMLVVCAPLGLWVIAADNLFFPWLNTNQYCAFVNMIAVFVMIYVFGANASRRRDWAALLGLVAIQIVLHLTTSRTGVVVHAGLLLFVPIMMRFLCGVPYRWRVQLGLVGSFVGLFFVVQTPLMGGEVADHMSINTLTLRSHIWVGALQAYQDYPVLGSGLGTFITAYAPHAPLGDTSAGLSAHNDVLHMLVEGGPVAVALVVGIFATAFYGLTRQAWSPDRLAMLLALLVYIAHGVLTTLWPHPAILVLLAAVLAHIPARSERPHPYSSRFRLGLQIGLAVWVIYTLSITMGGIHMRQASGALQRGDLPALVGHLRAANHIYVPDHPGAGPMLRQIEDALQAQPETFPKTVH